MDNIVYKYKGFWYWSEIPDDDKHAEKKLPLKELVQAPITDSCTIDTFIIGDGNKYGIYTLVSALGMGMAARYISPESDPFPYDEIKMRRSDYTQCIVGVRKGDSWGLMLIRQAFKPNKTFGMMARHKLTDIKYGSLEEAEHSFWGKGWCDFHDFLDYSMQ